jgi:hypothetical protein
MTYFSDSRQKRRRSEIDLAQTQKTIPYPKSLQPPRARITRNTPVTRNTAVTVLVSLEARAFKKMIVFGVSVVAFEAAKISLEASAFEETVAFGATAVAVEPVKIVCTMPFSLGWDGLQELKQCRDLLLSSSFGC